jgi:hypothetical protein
MPICVKNSFQIKLELIINFQRLVLADCRTSFCHIHRHKAASHIRQELAESRYSHCIKINVSYRETHASAAGWFEPITNVLNHSLFIVFNEIKNLFLNM